MALGRVEFEHDQIGRLALEGVPDLAGGGGRIHPGCDRQEATCHGLRRRGIVVDDKESGRNGGCRGGAGSEGVRFWSFGGAH
jgi:hypothetical protein